MRGPEETPGKLWRSSPSLGRKCFHSSPSPVCGLAVFTALSSSFSPWTKFSWWSKQARSSWQGPGEENANGMSSSGKCICKWEFSYLFFWLSWLLTVEISFQVEFLALIWLLMQKTCFSKCISSELPSCLPWMLPWSHGSAYWTWTMPPLSEKHALASSESMSCPIWKRAHPWETGCFTHCKNICSLSVLSVPGERPERSHSNFHLVFRS